MNITKTLTKLQTDQACGPDRIGNAVLKTLPSLPNSLLVIFKTALNKGFFPTYWKISEVILLLKSQDRAMIEPYRPISFSCSISKVSEKLNFAELYVTFKTQLDQSQYGFRRHRSVVTQLFLFLDLLYKENDEKENELYVLYLDFKKLLIVFHTTCCSKIRKNRHWR